MELDAVAVHAVPMRCHPGTPRSGLAHAVFLARDDQRTYLDVFCTALTLHHEVQDHRSSRLHHFVSGVILSQVLCLFTGVLGQAELPL